MTLIELLIAIMIMGIAVVTLVTALSDTVVASSNQRGYSVLETVAHQFAEAIQKKMDFRSSLSAGVTASQTTITLTDNVSSFQENCPFDVVVEQEVMTVTSCSGGASATVTRGADHSSAVAHSAGVSVIPLIVCPAIGNPVAPATSSSLTGDNGGAAAGSAYEGYVYPDGFTATPPSTGVKASDISASVSGIDYWNPSTNTFDSSATNCWNRMTGNCPSSVILPQCDAGVERVSLLVSYSYGIPTGQNSTVTQVIIRRGSA